MQTAVLKSNMEVASLRVCSFINLPMSPANIDMKIIINYTF